MDIIEGSEHHRRTLGVTTAPDHTSETQQDRWIGLAKIFYDIYNASLAYRRTQPITELPH